MTDIKNWLKPLKLSGGTQLPNRLFPGPMEGIGGPFFRRALESAGLADFWITPFIRISINVPRKNRLARILADWKESKLPVIVQLLGSDPELVATSAKEIKELGFAGINLNFACPSKMVTGSGGGGAMLKCPDAVRKVVLAVKQACPDFSVSVKLRSGVSDPNEINQIVPALRDTGIDFMILHFRTVREMYDPVPGGPERTAKAVELAGSLPVIGNGDIDSIEKAEKMGNISGCAGICAARGLFRAPSLFPLIKSHISGKPMQNPPMSKDELFNALREQCGERGKSRGKKNLLVEYAKCIWGKNSPEFQRLISSFSTLHS